MKCYIKGYNKSKYEADAEKIFQYDLEIEEFEVVTGEENLNCEVDEPDYFHEYLVIYFADGSRTTYKNSRVDLFRY